MRQGWMIRVVRVAAVCALGTVVTAACNKGEQAQTTPAGAEVGAQADAGAEAGEEASTFDGACARFQACVAAMAKAQPEVAVPLENVLKNVSAALAQGGPAAEAAQKNCASALKATASNPQAPDACK